MAITVLERRHEVWHADDRGDWRLAYFDLELPITHERVARRYEETVRNWIDMLAAEDQVMVGEPHLYPFVCYIPDAPDRMGERRFYMSARWKRLKPELLPLDTVAALVEQGPIDQEAWVRQFLEGIQGTEAGRADPDKLMAQIRENDHLRNRAMRRAKGARR